MAGAPTPGIGRRAAAAASAQSVMNLTINGVTKRLAIGNIPLSERLIVRKATDLPFEAFVAEDRFGMDTLVVLWWLARRGEGESMLTLNQCAADFPTDIGPDDIEVTVDEPDGDDPEA